MAIYYQNSLDRIFHALGDSTRREMLSILSKNQELSASKLAEPFNISQPTASKHIKVLEKSSLVVRNKQGRTHYFSLNPSTLFDAQDWINRHREFWLGSFTQLKQLINELPEEDKNE
ncbi:MAG: ArsR/SmtB family transcription factor [Thiohalomonadales bacterium]